MGVNNLPAHGDVTRGTKRDVKPMLERTRIANGRKSKVRSRVEHVFAEQKYRMGLLARTIGIARATAKIGMVNIVYNIKRLICLKRMVPA